MKIKYSLEKSVIVSFTLKKIQIFVCVSSWRTKNLQRLGQRYVVQIHSLEHEEK